MGPITAIIPRPRLVSAGGESFRVSELRLCDLAELQGWLDSRAPDPLAEYRALPATADGETRRLTIVAAYEAAEAGGPVLWEPSGQEALATPGGIVLFLWVAIRRDQPDWTEEDAAELFAKISPAEFSRIREIAYGDTPLDVAERLLLGDVPEPPRRARKLWPEILCETAEGDPVKLRALYDLTLTEFVYLRTDGKPPVRGREIGSGEDAAEVARRQYERFHGTSAPEPPEDTEATQCQPCPSGDPLEWTPLIGAEWETLGSVVRLPEE